MRGDWEQRCYHDCYEIGGGDDGEGVCVCDGVLTFYSREALISSFFIACVFSRVYASDLLLGFLIGPVHYGLK